MGDETKQQLQLAAAMPDVLAACKAAEVGLQDALKLIPRRCDPMPEVQNALTAIVSIRLAVAKVEGRTN